MNASPIPAHGSAPEKPWSNLYPTSVANFVLDQQMTLATMLEDSACAYGSRTALTYEGRTWSFHELARYAGAFSRLLRAHGLERGDRVALALPNRPEYVVALFGTLLAGGVVVQVNHRYPRNEIERILDDCQAAVVVATASTATTCATGSPDFLGRIFIRVGTTGELTEPHASAFEDAAAFLDQPMPDHAIAPDDLAVLQYTGGTTGAAKGVMLTHRNLAANVQQRCAITYDLLELPPNAKTVNVLPMCHVFGLTAVTLSAIRCGMNQILLSTFDPARVLDILATEQPFVFTGVPTMYTALMRAPGIDEAGLDKVTIYNSAGAGFPLEHLRRFEQLTGGRIIEGFGISEASPSTHVNPLFTERRIGSVGIPLPSTDVRIVDRDGGGTDPLPTGEVGEMLIRGPQIMRGYWNQPEQTAEALRDGWLATGDLAHMDADGFFYIDGRKKDMIVAGGFNVYPAEIEQILARYPGVIESAVVGKPDLYRGETVYAFIVHEPGQTIDPSDLDAHCRSLLAGYKVPTEYRFVDSLPRTAVGKIAKNKL